MTIVLILITVVISVAAFGNQNYVPESMQRPEWFDKLKFNAYQIYNKKQYYRFISSGFVHGSWWHLIFNMMTLYFFGEALEQYFVIIFSPLMGKILYIVLYISAIAVSSLSDLFKYKNYPAYNAVGASGAVSAVLFATILFNPKMGIYMFFIPIPIPGYIFAPLYLFYCYYMAKRGADNIGHSAHFWGAIYGLVFPLALKPDLIQLFLSYFS